MRHISHVELIPCVCGEYGGKTKSKKKILANIHYDNICMHTILYNYFWRSTLYIVSAVVGEGLQYGGVIVMSPTKVGNTIYL